MEFDRIPNATDWFREHPGAFERWQDVWPLLDLTRVQPRSVRRSRLGRGPAFRPI